MTPRQRRFVDEYLIDLDGTHAAIRAGYRRSSACEMASMLLARPTIADAVAAAMAERSRRTGITPERVLEELARIAFVDWRNLASWGPDDVSLLPSRNLSADKTAAIAAVGAGKRSRHVAVATYDKKRALETLARILGLRADPPKTAESP